jgi:hypothetical protein
MNHTEFKYVFDNCDEVVTTEVVTTFENKTGYFDHGVTYDTGKPVGTTLKGKDKYGRKLLVHVTPLGNVVIFERYKDGANGVIVMNAPDAIHNLYPGAKCTVPEISIGGVSCMRLGHVLSGLLK